LLLATSPYLHQEKNRRKLHTGLTHPIDRPAIVHPVKFADHIARNINFSRLQEGLGGPYRMRRSNLKEEPQSIFLKDAV
jgi:hypothetical protein